jgi:hypothetical protein
MNQADNSAEARILMHLVQDFDWADGRSKNPEL